MNTRLVVAATLVTLIASACAAPSATTVVVGNLVYSSADRARNYERFVHRVPLSAADQGVRDRLIEALRRSLGVASRAPVEGIIYRDAGVQLTYVSGPDDFEAEILIADFTLAKRNVETYLARQGLSAKGICDLPLSYYVGGIRESLPAGTRFDPNPLACG